MRKIYRQGNRGKVPVLFHPLGNTPCRRERQGYGKFTLRYACAGFQWFFSRKLVGHATHGWRFGECASGKGYKKCGQQVDCPQGGRIYFIGIQFVRWNFVTEIVTYLLPERLQVTQPTGRRSFSCCDWLRSWVKAWYNNSLHRTVCTSSSLMRFSSSENKQKISSYDNRISLY